MPKARLVFDGDNVYIGKDARIYWLKDDIATKIDWIPWVIDSLDSTSTTDALSANMGRNLQDQIDSMSWVGIFLSTWDCTTWLPWTNPQQDPYTYKVWDYYVVSAVGATNYKPHWGTFTQWVPSTTVETENVWINDKYYFDWADWVRIPNTAIQITIDSALSTSSTNAVENRAIANAVNAKQDIITDLSTIRTWASKWATALQPNDNISQLTNNVGYQTAGDVAAAIAWKQDILSAWDWISITSNTVTNTKPGTAVSSVAPSSPTEWMLWYDTINHVLKIYNWADWETVDTDSDTTYTAWSGINISAQNEISVDTSVIATKQYVDDSVAEVIPSWGTAPQNPQEWDLWYDTVNHVLKIYNWTSWETVDTDTNTTYTAWNGINIDANNEISVDTTIIPTQADLVWKQDVLTAWDNIQISAQNVISATDTTYTAWEWIAILNWNDYSAMRWPCPEGFHIPTKDEWTALNTLWISIGAWTADTWGDALRWYLKIPLSWLRSYTTSDPTGQDTQSCFWCSTTSTGSMAQTFSTYLNGTISFGNAYTTSWRSIRPFKDEPTIPDNTWTTIYTSDAFPESRNIKWSQSLWLITLSYDWTYITISDKNLWATTVYSNWTTLSEANCWKYYQWWNNYWFAWTWSVTTDNTQVDAGNYWPWNYFSSSIFITLTDTWDSSNNKNLWWWVTWVVQLNNAITSTQLSDEIFSSSWDWDTTHAPSKNAIYDVLGDVETLLANL